MKTPISRVRRAPTSRAIRCRNWPCSGRDLHRGLGVIVGVFALAAERLGLAQRDGADVVRHFVGNGG